LCQFNTNLISRLIGDCDLIFALSALFIEFLNINTEKYLVMKYTRNSEQKKPDRTLQDFTHLKKFTSQQFLKAINGSGGIKTTIARRLKCSRPPVDSYLNKNQELYDAWLDEKESMLDMCESGLIALAEKNDLGAIKYFLSTQAKDRGYGDT
jgi:hypothetical protein